MRRVVKTEIWGQWRCGLRSPVSLELTPHHRSESLSVPTLIKGSARVSPVLSFSAAKRDTVGAVRWFTASS